MRRNKIVHAVASSFGVLQCICGILALTTVVDASMMPDAIAHRYPQQGSLRSIASDLMALACLLSAECTTTAFKDPARGFRPVVGSQLASGYVGGSHRSGMYIPATRSTHTQMVTSIPTDDMMKAFKQRQAIEEVQMLASQLQMLVQKEGLEWDVVKTNVKPKKTRVWKEMKRPSDKKSSKDLIINDIQGNDAANNFDADDDNR